MTPGFDDFLADLEGFLEKRADGPRPNEAMNLLVELRGWRERFKRSSEAHGEWAAAMELAAQHVEAQHVVWDQTPVPASVILDMLAENLRALKASPHLSEQPSPSAAEEHK